MDIVMGVGCMENSGFANRKFEISVNSWIAIVIEE